MKTKTFIALITLTLAACAPAQLTPSVSATDAQNTAISIVGTGVALTQTALPMTTHLPPTLTPSATMVYPTSSPYPTNPPTIVITPDPIQVERWQEYQTELAKVLLFEASAWSPDYYEHSLCEWVILGRSGQEVYIWAVCTGPSTVGKKPAVIYLEGDGSVQEVKAVSSGTSRFQELFPVEIQEKILSCYSNFHPGAQELYDHLTYRESHWDVPPLIILSAMPTATPSP